MLPRLYAILVAGRAPIAAGETGDTLTAAIVHFVAELAVAGVTLIQYRNKRGSPQEMLEDARALREALPKHVRLIMNDRADLALAAGFDGVHIGQDDLSVAGARRVCAQPMMVGVSTHNPEQMREADGTSVDYIAIGPIFSTSSKAVSDPVIGLEGLKSARKLTRKPLVAIGGITRENCRKVIDSGADSVAVISDLLTDPRKSSGDFLRILM